MTKKLWFDCETTGLDKENCAIIQIAGLIEINGEIKHEFNLTCRPHKGATINPEALEVNKISPVDLANRENPKLIFDKLDELFGQTCSKFDSDDKMTPCGQNVAFDIDFLKAMWGRYTKPYFLFAHLDWPPIDTMYVAALLMDKGKMPKMKCKLENLCEHFQVEPGGHDALGDVKATRNVYHVMKGLLI